MTALSASIDPIYAQRSAFLGVERSARGKRWVERLDEEGANTAEAIAQQHALPRLLARVLAARGARPGDAADFLDPTLKRLMPDPSSLRDMDAGADRLAAAIVAGEPVAVFGDYDVDGAASAALMIRFLRAHGLGARLYIPDRITEGYGPSEDAFAGLVEEGCTLIVAVDCGTLSHEPVVLARGRGTDVIVLDHHLAGEHLPEAVALVNPNRLDDISGQGHLAAAGVTFLFLVAVARALRVRGWYASGRPECDLRAWLDLVALATVCDVVPLKGLNRAFVAKGLQVMKGRRNPGLRALADASDLSSEPDAYHLGFVFGPRINAGGRIGDASLGARLLSTDDDLEAAEIAATLDRLNGERRATEAVITEEAVAQAEFLIEARPERPVVVVQGDAWHKGVIGLVASRVVERFGLPAVAIAWDAGGQGTASARSIAGADIGEAIKSAAGNGLLTKGGGHSMAAGLTIERPAFEAFERYLESQLGSDVNRQTRIRSLSIDGALMPSAATGELFDTLNRAGPFGSGNPRPRFAFAAHRCGFAKVVGDAHIRCALTAGDGSRINAIAFRAAGTPLGALLLESDGMPLHVAGHLSRNDWGGRVSVELVIEDAAEPQRG